MITSTFKLNETKNILLFSIIILFFISLIKNTSWVAYLENILSNRMDSNPLPAIYFPTFVFIGLLYPITYLVLNRKEQATKRVIYPYLLLFATQVSLEIVFVFAIGKGMGTVVGLIFSIARLFQLNSFDKSFIRLNGLNRLINIEILLWSINIVQISFNRLIPILNFL